MLLTDEGNTMANRETSLKSLFESLEVEKEWGRVFMIMPFEARHADELYEVVKFVCKLHNLKLVRGDHRAEGGVFIRNILKEIKKAEIILVDLTGLNKNVLYELGIAHVLNDDVILLCPEAKERIGAKDKILPANLRAFQYVEFDQFTARGRKKLIDDLFEIIEDIMRKTRPKIIPGVLERTNQLIKDLDELLRLSPKKLSGETVWFSGGLSAFAIHPNEPFDAAELDDPSDAKRYQKALQTEKKRLIELAQKGCLIKCILGVPNKRFIRPRKGGYIGYRLCHLLAFLEGRAKGSKKALPNIEWMVSGFRQKNFYIIGRRSCMEGFKRENRRGFPLTFRQTNSYVVDANIEMYNILFKELEKDRFGKELPWEPIEAYRETLRKDTIKAVKAAMKLFPPKVLPC